MQIRVASSYPFKPRSQVKNLSFFERARRFCPCIKRSLLVIHHAHRMRLWSNVAQYKSNAAAFQYWELYLSTAFSCSSANMAERNSSYFRMAEREVSASSLRASQGQTMMLRSWNNAYYDTRNGGDEADCQNTSILQKAEMNMSQVQKGARRHSEKLTFVKGQ